MGTLDDNYAERIVGRLNDSSEAKLLAARSPELTQAAGQAAQLMIETLFAGGKVLFCGNGGSSMDAGHLAAELLGRFYLERPGLASVALSDSTAAMTAIGNDYGYRYVFSRQVEALGREGDVLIGLTTSGASENVLEAFSTARAIGCKTVALTGARGTSLVGRVDVLISVPSEDTPRIQEVCLNIGHTLCELAESALSAAQTSS